MARRKKNVGPQSPFQHAQTVKVKLADGTYKTGQVSFIGWLPFPGAWCFEVQSEGVTYKTLSEGRPERRIVALTDDLNEQL